MSGWLSRLFDTSAVPQDYTAPANQLGPLARQVMTNPVGTETTSPYASQSVGVPSGPFNPIEAMTPNGPMLGTDVDRAHEIVRQGIQEYAPTLLGMVGDAPSARMPSGMVDVGDVTAHVNPSRADIARMMEAAQNHHLRVFHEGPNIAIWPAYDATHAQMAEPLGFTKAAAPMDYYGRPEPPDADFSNRAGRFSFMAVGR